MTTTQRAPRSLEPDTRRPRRAIVAALAAVAVVVALTIPLWVSGWTPWGQTGPAALLADPAAPIATGVTETPGRFQDDVLQAAWRGSAAWPLAPASGTVTVDAWVGRVEDADPGGDYYVVHVVTSWTHVDGMARLPAPVQLSVVSDTASTSHVHGATRSFVSSAGCDAVLALPATAGASGHLGTASVCRGYGMALLDEDETSATWQVDQPAGLRQVEVVYAQKVPEGALPVWTVRLATPTGRTADVPWHTGAAGTSSISATVLP